MDSQTRRIGAPTSWRVRIFAGAYDVAGQHLPLMTQFESTTGLASRGRSGGPATAAGPYFRGVLAHLDELHRQHGPTGRPA